MNDSQDYSFHSTLSNGIGNLFSSVPIDKKLWIADTFVEANRNPSGENNFAVFFSGGYSYVSRNGDSASTALHLANWRLFTSGGTETEHEADVMAVVLLKPNVKLNKSEDNIWSLNE